MGPWNRLGSRHNASPQKPGRVHGRASSETLNEKTPPILPIGRVGVPAAFVDEAAAVKFGAMNGDRFVQLTEALLKLLEK
jgi:hypothetical protein